MNSNIKYYIFPCKCLLSCELVELNSEGKQLYHWKDARCCDSHKAEGLKEATHTRGPEYYNVDPITKTEAAVYLLKREA
jgi:hypothetical protein